MANTIGSSCLLRSLLKGFSATSRVREKPSENANELADREKGWLTVLAWQSIVASGGYLSGAMIQGLLILNYPQYVPQQWQGTLLFWATIAVSVFVNTVVSSLLPKIEGFIFTLHVLGAIAILIVMSYMAPHSTASEVFTLFLNQGDWSTQGLSFMIGLIGMSFSFVGTHLTYKSSSQSP